MLTLSIFTENGENLFSGKLKDFSKLAKRKLAKNEHEALTIKLGLPAESGNEFQGLACEVEFTISSSRC